MTEPIQIYNPTADDINAGLPDFTEQAGRPAPQQRVPAEETPGIKSSGPVRVGKLLEPLRQIIGHPDRNRLMAELFRDYK